MAEASAPAPINEPVCERKSLRVAFGNMTLSSLRNILNSFAGWSTTREPQPYHANDRFQDDPHMNLRAPTIAFVEDNRDLGDLELARFPDAVSGFDLEQIPDGEYP